MTVMAVLFATALVPTAVMAGTLGLEHLERHLLRPRPPARTQTPRPSGLTALLRFISENPRSLPCSCSTTRNRSGRIRAAESMEGSEMRAQAGDRIAVETTTLDLRRRSGVVLEVLGADEQPPYRVRWDDGHESVYFPGPDAHVVSPS
jgi:translation initiation factor IF-1